MLCDSSTSVDITEPIMKCLKEGGSDNNDNDNDADSL